MATGDNYTIQNSIGEIDWSRLTAGSVVTIPFRPDPSGATPELVWKEKWLLSTPGITVRGKVGPNGQLPTIDGENATTHSQFICRRWVTNGVVSSIEDAGVITIDGRNGGPRPSNITIDGLRIRGACLDNIDPTFMAYDGTKRTYAKSSAGIYCVTGDDVTVRNCVIENNGNGVLVIGSQGCKRWLIEDCHIGNNGISGSDRQHNTYCEVLDGITYRRVKYGSLRNGSQGGHLKDRSCGPVVDSCEFTGISARTIDFSGPQDTIAEANNDPKFLLAKVINCLIKNISGGSSSIFYAEGRGDKQYTITLLNNTVDIIRDQSEIWRIALTKTEATTPIIFELERNLIQFAPITSGNKSPEISLSAGRGIYKIRANWSSTGLLKCRTGVQDYGTYDGWEQIIYPPAPKVGFGCQTIIPPVPPIVPPTPIWETVAESITTQSDKYRVRQVIEKIKEM